MQVSVDWMEGWGNTPNFVIHCSKDNIPELVKSEFTNHSGLWVHVSDNGFVHYFAHKGIGNEGGYSGAPFTFLHNGQIKTRRGPWSSRAGCVNQLGYNIVDVVVDDNGSRYSAAITLALLVQLLDEQKDVDFYVILDTEGEPVYYPSIVPDKLMKPSGQVIDGKTEFQCVWEPL